jgi:zinc protease
MKIPIEQHRLDNGLRVILSPDRTNAVAAVNLWYNVGSRNERPGRTGLAHLFEHMMFQGSLNVPETQYIAHIERAGGSGNATTWLDRTNYYATVPSHHLELPLWMESDRMGFFLPALTQEKLDNQRDVVKNERRQRVDNAPYGDWDERLQALLFPEDHPYHHSVIGSMADLDEASLTDVADFFRTYYAPNNAVISLVGDFESDHALRLVERWFGPIPAGPPVPPLPGRPALEPFRLGGERREVVEADVPLPRVHLAFRTPPFGSDAYAALDLLTEVLAGGKGARLYAELVRERRVARAVAAFAFPVVTGASLSVLRGTTHPGGDPAVLERALTEHLDRIAASGPRPEEMDRARAGLQTRHLLELQRVATRADHLSMFTTLFDDPERINTEIDRLSAVTAEQVRAVAAEYFGADNRVVLTYLPRRAGEVAS